MRPGGLTAGADECASSADGGTKSHQRARRDGSSADWWK
jgi:hypothetical protein